VSHAASDSAEVPEPPGGKRKGTSPGPPAQPDGADAGPADYNDGHYVVVVGLPAGLVIAQDSMADVETDGANSVQVPGKVLIAQDRFLSVWHDRDTKGRYYLRFGIVVSKPEAEKMAETVQSAPGGKDVAPTGGHQDVSVHGSRVTLVQALIG
jgi:hypothetical protein